MIGKKLVSAKARARNLIEQVEFLKVIQNAEDAPKREIQRLKQARLDSLPNDTSHVIQEFQDVRDENRYKLLAITPNGSVFLAKSSTPLHSLESWYRQVLASRNEESP